MLSQRDPLWSPCEAGAAGDEAKAKLCMDGWRARLPALTAQVANIRKILWQTFPNEKDGKPYSGSYWNEADYEDPAFQISHWGKFTNNGAIIMVSVFCAEALSSLLLYYRNELPEAIGAQEAVLTCTTHRLIVFEYRITKFAFLCRMHFSESKALVQV